MRIRRLVPRAGTSALAPQSPETHRRLAAPFVCSDATAQPARGFTGGLHDHRDDGFIGAGRATDTASLLTLDFFSAAEARIDQWRQLSAVARAWQAAAARGASDDAPLRRGDRVVRRAGAARSVLRLSGSAAAGRDRTGAGGTQCRRLRPAGAARLHGAADRHLPPRSRRPGIRCRKTAPARSRPAAAGHAGRQRPQAVFRDAGRHAGGPVAVGARAARPEAAAARRRRVRLRGRAGRAPSRTRCIATICNHNLQAVVIRDGFEYRSRHDVPVLREFLLRHLQRRRGEHRRPARWRPTLARAVKRYRPELDVYLLTDRAVEALAGSDEAAPLRRIFHDVEELMELHLAHPRRHRRSLRHAVSSTT